MKKALLVLLVTAIALLATTARASAQLIDSQYVSATSSDCSTAGSCATFNPGATPSVTYVVSGTFTATLTFEGTADGVNWTAINVVNVSTSANSTTTTAGGTFSFANSGFLQVRVRCSAYTSGTAKITATRGWAVARLFNPVVSSIGTADGSATAAAFNFATEPNTGFYRPATGVIAAASFGSTYQMFGNGVFRVGSGTVIGWSTNANPVLAQEDTALQREGVGLLAQRFSTTAQTSRTYNTWTDAGNYERATFGYTGNVLIIGHQAAGTGTAARVVRFVTGGANYLALGATNDSNWNATTAGALLGIVPTGGVGYGAGAGAAVTQLTSKSTGVTSNTITGQITMNNASLAATTTVGFTLTNSAIAATDVVLVTIKSGATANSYQVQVSATAAGSCLIEVRNTTAGALGEAVVLNYVVIKGSAS
jgi:hypothetical protein